MIEFLNIFCIEDGPRAVRQAHCSNCRRDVQCWCGFDGLNQQGRAVPEQFDQLTVAPVEGCLNALSSPIFFVEDASAAPKQLTGSFFYRHAGPLARGALSISFRWDLRVSLCKNNGITVHTMQTLFRFLTLVALAWLQMSEPYYLIKPSQAQLPVIAVFEFVEGCPVVVVEGRCHCPFSLLKMLSQRQKTNSHSYSINMSGRWPEVDCTCFVPRTGSETLNSDGNGAEIINQRCVTTVLVVE